MKKTWKDVHRLYWEFPAIVEDERYSDMNGVRITVLSGTNDNCDANWYRNSEGGYWQTDGIHVKPILRRPESITVEEQKELFRELEGTEEDIKMFFNDWPELTLHDKDTVRRRTHLKRMIGEPNAILWLCAKGFCLWPELFESGEVLEEKS